LNCIQTAAARDSSAGPPVSPRPPLFRCHSCICHLQAPRPGRCRPRRVPRPFRPHASPLRGAARDSCLTPYHIAYKVRPSPPHPPFPFRSQLWPPEDTHPLNTMTPSRGCSSTRTPSPHQNLAGEPPPLLCHPLLVSRPYALFFFV
jgi:hypothetical protein